MGELFGMCVAELDVKMNYCVNFRCRTVRLYAWCGRSGASQGKKNPKKHAKQKEKKKEARGTDRRRCVFEFIIVDLAKSSGYCVFYFSVFFSWI